MAASGTYLHVQMLRLADISRYWSGLVQTAVTGAPTLVQRLLLEDTLRCWSGRVKMDVNGTMRHVNRLLVVDIWMCLNGHMRMAADGICPQCWSLPKITKKFGSGLLRMILVKKMTFLTGSALDPTKMEVRSACIKPTTSLIQAMVKRFPMVSFHADTQGTHTKLSIQKDCTSQISHSGNFRLCPWERRGLCRQGREC